MCGERGLSFNLEIIRVSTFPHETNVSIHVLSLINIGLFKHIFKN